MRLRITIPSKTGNLYSFLRVARFFPLILFTSETALGQSVPSPSSFAADQIVLFRDANFNGACAVRGRGNYPTASSAGIPDNWVSSFNCGPSVQVRVYEKAYFEGKSELFTQGAASLGNHPIGNDRISSFKVQSLGTAEGAVVSGTVGLFKDNNYHGPYVVLNAGGYYNANDIGLLDNTISSIKVGANVKVTLYDKDYFQGSHKIVQADVPTLSKIGFNDKISSLLISYTNSQAPAMIGNSTEAPLATKAVKATPILQKQPRSSRDIIGILFDMHCADSAAPTVQEAKNMMNAVSDYFSENSDGRLSINVVGVLGPYNAKHACAFYSLQQNKDSDGDGFKTEAWAKYKEAVVAAADQYNFSLYDRNGDKTITKDELVIVILVPGTYSRGFTRQVLEKEVPSKKLLKVNGVTIKDDIVELYMNSAPLNISTNGMLLHELSHILLNHTDYYVMPNPMHAYSPGTYSPMDMPERASHLDPVAKLKFGWICPKVITKSGQYTLEAVETGHTVWVLMDPRKGSDEYFIIENRCQQLPTFDRDLYDLGLAIWHVIEKESIWKNLSSPQKPFDDWGRRGVRLIRSSQPPNDSFALWHGPTTALSQVTLHWANGNASGFSLKDISTSGQFMTARITIPNW